MTEARLAPGPVIVDVQGTQLTEAERRRLLHPLVGGVILFARNFAGVEQLSALCAQIHSLRTPPLLIAVDHEGGRVQRFREGFTPIPAMACVGALWSVDPAEARRAARAAGYVLAAELRACGVDLSFTPVLDLEYGASSVIGDRALHADPAVVAELAAALLAGLRQADMRGVGKHFPGHGFVSADSHLAVPVDNRPLEEIVARDVHPYRVLAGELGGVMPAHVIFDACDPQPAGFSPFWLKRVLRSDLGFAGTIFSDDLSMEGAAVAGDVVARAQAARSAGCDAVLVCNEPERADELLARWTPAHDAELPARLAKLGPRAAAPDMKALSRRADYAEAVRVVAEIPARAPRGQGCGG